MLDDLARPSCPMCHAITGRLIATLKDGRTLDIYLCEHCRTQFGYERSPFVLAWVNGGHTELQLPQI